MPHTTVSQIITKSGGRDTSSINHLPTPGDEQQIISPPFPFSGPKHDGVTWTQSGSGKFLVESCYKFILK